MADFREHPVKSIIRENWCKPILEHLHSILGYKLVYLGLPGTDALDIKCWIDYLEKIIAFECRVYGSPSDPNQPRDRIEKLENTLDGFERQGKIRTFSLFDGYIEEVVSKGKDNIGTIFSQKDVVNIYNLDFCNTIFVPMPSRGRDDSDMIFKIEALRKLLEFQRDTIHSESKKFILFLTVNSNFLESGEVESVLKGQNPQLFSSYVKKISSLKDTEKNIRLLKFYIFHVLRNHFCDCQFVPDFFPPIVYKGSGGQWMMTFTIMGTSYIKTASASAPCYQKAEDFLNNKMLLAENSSIDLCNTRLVEEIEIPINNVELFCKMDSYQKHWKRD